LSRDLDNLLPLIIDGLSGRTWQGKEHVVELLAAVTANSKDYFAGKKDKLQEIAKVTFFFHDVSRVLAPLTEIC